MDIQLVAFSNYYGHVSQDTIAEFEHTIIGKSISKTKRVDTLQRVLGKRIWKYVMHKYKWRLSADFLKREEVNRFCVVMGIEFDKCILAFLYNKYNSVYFFDAWVHNHDKIEEFIKLAGVTNVFFSSRQVTEMFRSKQLKCNFYWVPEGVDTAVYKFNDYSKKDIDVLCFGRKYDALHNKIEAGLAQRGISYLYEKQKGKLVFDGRSSFIDGLARAKISICIPSDITHPERAGAISTMTIRYLQSMASKTLIVGYMPEEMKELFDYCPIVEVNMKDPLEQLLGILGNFNSYIPLIERNYRFINEHHTWGTRWNNIRDIIETKSSIKLISSLMPVI
jgi:hypothetical protein